MPTVSLHQLGELLGRLLQLFTETADRRHRTICLLVDLAKLLQGCRSDTVSRHAQVVFI